MIKTEGNQSPILSNLLMELLVCPVCKGDLNQLDSPDKPMLSCPVCRLSYPIDDGIPVMLLDQAIPHHQT